MSWQRNRIVRQVRARPRLFMTVAIAIAIGALLPTSIVTHAATRWLVAWNVGTCLYVLLAAIMMIRSSHHHMRHRAQIQDDGQLVILALVVVSAVASLVAIGGQLAVVKDAHYPGEDDAKALLGGP